MRCFIWGTGRTYDLMMAIGYWRDKECIKGIVSPDIDREHIYLHKYKLYRPEDIVIENFDYIIVANNKWKEIIIELLNLGINKEKIIVPYVCEFEKDNNVTLTKMLKLFENADLVYQELTLFNTCGLIIPMGRDIWDLPLSMNVKYIVPNIYSDYIRIRTLELLGQEIREQHVKGSMAEVGVFRGYFAKIMHTLFPDKKLYLYDTFEGFPEGLADKELNSGDLTDAWLRAFANTDLDSVKKYISEGDGCDKLIFRQGYFPNTIQDEKQESYCLVSLDADLFEPTFRGLEFFYPRLEKGGYIIIHDYQYKAWDKNTLKSVSTPGVREAIKLYEEKFGTFCKVPVCDKCGSLVITK